MAQDFTSDLTLSLSVPSSGLAVLVCLASQPSLSLSSLWCQLSLQSLRRSFLNFCLKRRPDGIRKEMSSHTKGHSIAIRFTKKEDGNRERVGRG